jgi:hypothetical protein
MRQVFNTGFRFQVSGFYEASLINEHFEENFNAVVASAIIFQHPVIPFCIQDGIEAARRKRRRLTACK